MFNKKEHNRQYYQKNKEKRLKQMKQYYLDNLEYMKEYHKKYSKQYDKQYYRDHPRDRSDYCKQWYKDNRERENEKHKQYNNANREKLREYRKNNVEKIRKLINRREKERKRTDLKFNLNRRIKDMMSHSLKGNKNGRHWESLVKYTLEDLIKQLKSTMPEGYAWQDYLEGKLQIDHIIPIRAFEFETPEDEEFKQCWSLYNLRLLTAKENISKRDKIINPILLNLLLNEAM